MGSIEDGVWEFLQERKLWHFDKSRQVSDFLIIGNVEKFIGKLADSDIELTDKRLANSMEHRNDNSSYFDRIHKGNLRDKEQYGFPSDLTYARVWDQKRATKVRTPKWISSLCAALPLEDPYAKVSVQMPGQVWPIHVDNYHAAANAVQLDDKWTDPGVRRLFVALDDWEWGQVINFGNSFWHHWRRGDVLYFDWLVPHGSANWGTVPRRTLQVTGSMTAELHAIAASLT